MATTKTIGIAVVPLLQQMAGLNYKYRRAPWAAIQIFLFNPLPTMPQTVLAMLPAYTRWIKILKSHLVKNSF